MTLKEIEIAIQNLQKSIQSLASRNYNGRIDDTKGEIRATKAEGKADIQSVSNEIADASMTMANFMEEYYLSNFSI